MKQEDVLYAIALTRVLPYQSQVQNQLLEAAGSAKALYEARHQLKDLIPDVSNRLSNLVSQMDNHLARAEEEMAFAEKNHIQMLARDDVNYPDYFRPASNIKTVPLDQQYVNEHKAEIVDKFTEVYQSTF